MLQRIYVDEAGDLGLSLASSRHFVFSAVIVAGADENRLRGELARTRASLGRHSQHALHFVKFSHSQRLKAVQDIAASSVTGVVNAVLSKEDFAEAFSASETTDASGARSVYLAAMGLLLERVSWFLSPNSEEAVVTFGQLKGLTAAKLRGYRAALEDREAFDISWPVFSGHAFRLRDTREAELLQLADITASAIFRAIEPDRFGNVETRYIDELRPKLAWVEPVPVSVSI